MENTQIQQKSGLSWPWIIGIIIGVVFVILIIIVFLVSGGNGDKESGGGGGGSGGIKWIPDGYTRVPYFNINWQVPGQIAKAGQGGQYGPAAYKTIDKSPQECADICNDDPNCDLFIHHPLSNECRFWDYRGFQSREPDNYKNHYIYKKGENIDYGEQEGIEIETEDPFDYKAYFDEIDDYHIIKTSMVDESIAEINPAFIQQSMIPGEGIPAELWDTQRISTAEDCRAYTDPANEMYRRGEYVDCSVDRDTLSTDPVFGHPGGLRGYTNEVCKAKFGGDNGMCKVGVPIGVGIPGLIEHLEEGVTGHQICAKHCLDDPNCALAIYTRRQSQYTAEQDAGGNCYLYEASAYPFRVQMGPPNTGVYSMYLRKSKINDLNAADARVTVMQERELQEVIDREAALNDYEQHIDTSSGGLYRGGCFSSDFGRSSNNDMAPYTNWLPVEDELACANLCTRQGDKCGSFVYHPDYGCVLSEHDKVYMVYQDNTIPSEMYEDLSAISNKTKCGTFHYGKK